jgi:hypothetical protein
MTTPQIIIIGILTVLITIGYIGTMLSKNDNQKTAWCTLQIFSTAFIIIVAITMTTERNECLEQLENKCPEYEKIENVYRLK